MIDPPDGNLPVSLFLLLASLVWRAVSGATDAAGAPVGRFVSKAGDPMLLQLGRGSTHGSAVWTLQREAAAGLAPYLMSAETARALQAGRLDVDGSSLLAADGARLRLRATWTGTAHVADLVKA